jgi:hypothetical protein
MTAGRLLITVLAALTAIELTGHSVAAGVDVHLASGRLVWRGVA